MTHRLITIPPEIQGLIGDHLHKPDLNSLTRTCKTLNGAFLAKLYGHVVIKKSPIRWSRLASLENLISSVGGGLGLVASIAIAAQQQQQQQQAGIER